MSAATLVESEVTVIKLLPGSLPSYTYVPGSSTPHPIRHPQGHSYGRKNRTVKPLSAENWQENRSFLLAIDLFNHGYYWEAHEGWESLWHAAGRRGAVATNSCSCSFQNFAMQVVPWPRVSSLAGIMYSLPFFARLSSRSMIPVSGGLRSSSAELMASKAGSISSRPGDGL